MVSRGTVMRASALSVGCVTQLLWGSAITYPLYANSLQREFNFTERTVAFLPVMTTLGRCLTPLPVAVLYLFGSLTSYLTGFLIGSGGFFLLWSAMFNKVFYFQHPQFLFLYFFLHGHGGLYSYLTAMPILVKLFSGPHEGKVISLLEAFYAGSPLLILAIYSQSFASDDPVAGNDDVAGFFLFKALSLTVCSVLCIVFVRDVPQSAMKQPKFQELTNTKSKTSDEFKADESISLVSPNSSNSPGDEKPDELTPLMNPGSKSITKSCENVFQGWLYSFKQAISSVMQWPILLVMASYCMAYPVCYGLEINLAAMTKSLGFDSYFNMLYLTYNLSVIGSRLLIGPLSDKLTGSVPRTSYIAIVSLLMTAALIAVCVQPASIATVFILVLTVGFYAGVMKCMTIAVLSREMGVEDLARNFGLCLLISPMFLALWQWFMASTYEASIVFPDTEGCYGNDCFRWSYIMSACLTALCTIFSTLVAVLKRY